MSGRFAWRSGLPVLMASAAVTALFLPAFCDLIYDCGCRHWWNGLAEACNIHTPGVPHCPWCSVGLGGFAAVFLVIVLPQAALSVLPAGWHWMLRLVASLAAFPVIGSGVALAMGWWMGYWRF